MFNLNDFSEIQNGSSISSNPFNINRKLSNYYRSNLKINFNAVHTRFKARSNAKLDFEIVLQSRRMI